MQIYYASGITLDIKNLRWKKKNDEISILKEIGFYQEYKEI